MTKSANIKSNDKLNYYKFGLGLGAVSAAVTGDNGKKGSAEATEAAAGGADQ
jgi:ATP-binding cassette subfamily D (ALD) long-chain fatty acid import protein